MPMHFDAIIIGAGMSGLAAGIRLAYFGKSVCIVERHYAFGGLNSYYKLAGREFDVGLHALTNYCPADRRNAPLAKLFRQLRLSRDDFDLCEQRYSLIQFPGRRLRFTNDIDVLIESVAEQFPGEIDRFRRIVDELLGYDFTRLDAPYAAARPLLADRLKEPLLIEMLLCPLMYYGSPEENDMDFTHFATLFRSIFCEGFARPRAGVRTVIKSLVAKFRSCGGKLRMNAPVRKLLRDGRRVDGVELESGESLTCDVLLSSAGRVETMRLAGRASEATDETGRISFVETIGILDAKPAELGHDATIVFFNDSPTFHYESPEGFVDLRSGVACCPNNYERHEDLPEGIFRVTWLANPRAWIDANPEAYERKKRKYLPDFIARASSFVPDFEKHVVFSDMFTPRTIRYYTGHENGAVYGSPAKRRDGRTDFENLFLCGTDQGFLGIVGAMLGGITVANLHVLGKD